MMFPLFPGDLYTQEGRSPELVLAAKEPYPWATSRVGQRVMHMHDKGLRANAITFEIVLDTDGFEVHRP